MDARRRTKFSICSSLSACISCPFLIWRMHSLSGEVHSIWWKVLCMHKIWNRLHWKKVPTGHMIAIRWHAFCFGTCVFLVLYLCSSYLLMSSGPDSRLDYYLTCNGSIGGVSDTDHIFCGQLLTRNAWKLTNNRCEKVVHGTKLMTYIFLGIITWLPCQSCERYKNVLQLFKERFVSCSFFALLFYPVLVRYSYGDVR